MSKTPKDIRERAFEVALRIPNCVSISIGSQVFLEALATNCSRLERQWELTLKKLKLVRADPISSARTVSP